VSLGSNKMLDAVKSVRRTCDVASGIFLLVAATNTALLATTQSVAICVPLAFVQALLLLGCQEAKHLAAHRTFFGNRLLNDWAGIACASLIGENFVAFRHFHFKHHLTTCNEDDPEGHLYALSWQTRWIWLLAPLEIYWVAFHINRIGGSLVLQGRQAAHRLSKAAWLLCIGTLAMACWLAPHAFAWAYAIPLAISAWIDLPLTQAEHFGVPVAPSQTRRGAQELANDIQLPLGLGWAMLHRSLHCVHHRRPNGEWIDAPRQLREHASAAPVAYASFARRWLRDGPRLWHVAASVVQKPQR
jgi:fatty acid desaturase